MRLKGFIKEEFMDARRTLGWIFAAVNADQEPKSQARTPAVAIRNSAMGCLKSGVSLLFCFAIISFSGLSPVWGQQITATITGNVIDPSGAPIVGAMVTARDVDRGTAYKTQTNSVGLFNFTRIPVASYELMVEAQGFQTLVKSPITLILDQTARIDLQMKVGSVTDTVRVSGEAPVLQTDTTQVSTLIGAQTNDRLPLATRNYVQLTLLSPGSVTVNPQGFNNGDNTASGSRPYINGNREQANSFLLDGMDNNQVSDNLLGYTPAPDAIQEFNLITQNAPAEFGRFQGGVVNTYIKSGTNNFHGDVWEYFRNDILNANQWENNFQSLPRPTLRWNMYGATLGGPIKKDKLFFFADYQGQRFDHPSTSQGITVFSNAERNGDFSALSGQLFNPCSPGTGVNGVRCVAAATRTPFPNNQIPLSMINVVAKNLFASKLYPVPVNNNPTNNAFNVQQQAFNADQGDIKIDLNASEKDRIFGRFTHGYQTNPSTNSFLLTGNPFSQAPTYNAVANWTHMFSPALLNEARFGVNYVRVTTGTTFDPSLGSTAQQLGIANGNIAGPGMLLLGFGGGQPAQPGTGTLTNVGTANIAQDFADTVIQLQEGLNYTHGHHIIHTGFQLWRYRINTFYSGNNGKYGSILFGGSFTGDPGADFFLGLPAASGRGISCCGWHQRSFTLAGYVQDDWRATNTLTFNLGLRYEAYTPWVEVNNRQANFGLFSGQLQLAGQNGNSRALYNGQYGLPAWQPRFGFAWSPARLNNETVIRGAYTISTYLEGTGTNLRLPLNPPFSAPETVATYTAPTATTDQGIVASVPGDPFMDATLRVWQPDVQPAIQQQWNFTIQQQLTPNTSLQVGYVGQYGTHLMVPLPFAQKRLNPDGTVSPSVFLSGNPSLVKDIGQISGTGSVGKMRYDALQAVLQRRLSGGLNAQVAYTYGKCMTDNIGYYGAGATTLTTNASPYWQNIYNPAAEWAQCYFDSKHVLSAFALYDLPFGHNRHFGSHWSGVANAALGGWSLGAIVSIHSGFPLAVAYGGTDPTGTGSRGPRPDCNAPVQIFGRQPALSATGALLGYQWFNPNTFSVPAAGTFGNCPASGPAIGPGYSNADLSLQKDFPITESKRFQFRSDFLNAFNNVNLNAPNTNFVPGSSSFGLINTSQTARNIQFALKFYW